MIETNENIEPSAHSVWTTTEGDYQQARQQFETGQLANETRTATFVNTIRNNRTLMEYELARDEPDMTQVEQYLVELESLQDKMREYALAILDLANIGIATPEYALASGRQSTSDGIVQLANFQKLHWRIGSLTDDMKNEGHSWLSALGGNGPVPATALLKYQTDIQDLQTQQQALRHTAQKMPKPCCRQKCLFGNPTITRLPHKKHWIAQVFRCANSPCPAAGPHLNIFHYST